MPFPGEEYSAPTCSLQKAWMSLAVDKRDMMTFEDMRAQVWNTEEEKLWIVTGTNILIGALVRDTSF